MAKLSDNAFAACIAYRSHARNSNLAKVDLDRDNTELVAEVMTDLLADLRHLADDLDLVFESLDERAAFHYSHEVG